MGKQVETGVQSKSPGYFRVHISIMLSVLTSLLIWWVTIINFDPLPHCFVCGVWFIVSHCAQHMSGRVQNTQGFPRHMLSAIKHKYAAGVHLYNNDCT